MFGTIRKHQGWLWAVIGGLTILSFAVFGPTNTRLGDIFGQKKGGYGMLAGRPITYEQRAEAQHELALDSFLKTQQWPDLSSAENIRQVYFRLFFIQKLDELGVHISTEAAATFARRLLGTMPLDDFAEKILKPVGMDASDFDLFLRHELGIEQLVTAAGTSGKLVTPQEAETMYRLEHQDIATLMVSFSASNYTSGVKATPEAVAQFYSNQIVNYKVPEEVQVSYVKFEVTNFFPAVLASLTNLDQTVEATSQKLGTNLYHGAKTPAESKAAIRTEILREHALVEARRVAGHFADMLDQATNRTEASLRQLAATTNLTVHLTAPFDREEGPQDIAVQPDFTKAAFSLNETDPFAGPIMTEDGVYIIALHKRIPSVTPSLAELTTKVTDDYKYMNGIQIAQQAAVEFSKTLSNGLAAGKSFNSICAQAGVKAESLPPFSLSTREMPEEIENRISFNLLKQVAFSTPPGTASPVAGSRDGAFILYAEKVLPVDETKVKAELPGFLAELRRVRQSEAFNQWFNGQVRQDPDFVQTLQKISEDAQAKAPARSPAS